MKNINKILIVIQRSNGDVFLSSKLIETLFEHFHHPQIDLLVNDDTIQVAKLLPHISIIHTFSYRKKQSNRLKQELSLIASIYRKYDLSISLTSSDRSVLYTLLASKKSISSVEKIHKKAWWKKILLTYYYYFDNSKHILLNNLMPLNLIGINHNKKHEMLKSSFEPSLEIKDMLKKRGINRFIIFHPSAQYDYKIYPKHLRDKLLALLNTLGVPIIITGSNNKVDLNIKKDLPSLTNTFDFIGKTTIKEYLELSQLADAYIGMDTLNMHIASMHNNRIFAIFGPTNLRMWSPWSNELQAGASKNTSVQTYGNITIFQAALPCVACGKPGCDRKEGRSECLHLIKPETIYSEVSNWYKNAFI